MIRTDDYEKVQITSPAELRDWLTRHHAQSESVWVVTWKKHTGPKYVSTDQILDELLCYGWIDGIRRKLDDDRTMQLIAPRKATHWTESYRQRAQRLEREGRMEAPGRAKIDEAKLSGGWNAMSDVDALEVPSDLHDALAACPPALKNFEGSSVSYRRNLLRWIKLAKKPETRRRRIAKIVDSAATNTRIPQM